ncbi:MAG TPA: carboxypeptidase regulatory-like domain-containing protein [Gaiellaceae bacterium]|nr:carboxypeptidase regulatory-like domain-containing protein [Gaiellaceae bacterium]
MTALALVPTAGSTPRRPLAASATLVAHLPAGNTALPPALAGGTTGGIALDASGDVYVGATLSGHSYVVVYDSSRQFVRMWPVDNRQAARGALYLAVGPDGLVYTAPQPTVESDGFVRVFSADGTLVRTLGVGSHMTNVSDIEVDAAGNVYVASSANRAQGIQDDVVMRLNPAGQVTGQWAPDPGGPTNSLRGIAVAPDGSVWVTADLPNQPLTHFDANGKSLPVPPILLAIPEAHPDQFADVDFAGGNLYFTGDFGPGHGLYPGGPNIVNGMVEMTPEGTLVDVAAGSGHGIAVASDGDVYATGLDASATPATTARAAAAADNTGGFGVYGSDHLTVPPLGSAHGSATCNNGSGTTAPLTATGPQLTLAAGSETSSDCSVWFTDDTPPPGCDHGSVPRPSGAWQGDRPLPTGDVNVVDLGQSGAVADVRIPGSQVTGGGVDVRYDCFGQDGSPTGQGLLVHKGDIKLEDPSGTVVDASGRPLANAAVTIQESPTGKGRFLTPALSSLSPQTLKEATGSDGRFGWDVAPGYWRMVVTAFGYRRYVSKAYRVPPAVTKLVFKLKADPRQQALLIDPAGRVGRVRVGRKPARVGGLSVTTRHGVVRSIAVRSKRFRTAAGITLGSSRGALGAAFPSLTRQTAWLHTKTLRVGKATFTLSKANRVAKIVVGR